MVSGFYFDFTEFYWVLLGLYGFYMGLLDLTRLYLDGLWP